MLKNNLRLLDMDEHIREAKEKLFEKEIAACKVLDFTLNLATSDISAYVEDNHGQSLVLD